jgi:hypothetical protein
LEIISGCLGVPDPRRPGPTKANVRYARWDTSEAALEWAESPSTITGFFCFDVPDVIPL